jgi:ketosteroid isomerase-like protein/predicted metal-dependent enzyme (double-stranded beta helix superfamily)
MATIGTTYTVQQFLADTRTTIKARGIPHGLAEIRGHLERLLANPGLLREHLGDPPAYTERTTLAHDPETDVHVLVHGRPKAGQSVPHDHGPCWVVYGAYRNATRMRRWRRVDGAPGPGHAELELQTNVLLEPGHADAFAPGDIHSIEYQDGAFFVRVTGGDVESQKTLRFDLENKRAELHDRAQVAGPTLARMKEINAAFNSRDVDRIMTFFSDDCTFLMSRGPEPVGRRVQGKEAVRRVLADRFEVISGMRWDHIDGFITGNRAVSVWTVTGQGADGERLNYRGCDVYEFRGDKILHKDTYWKIVEHADRL